jgi:hypothetical protein
MFKIFSFCILILASVSIVFVFNQAQGDTTSIASRIVPVVFLLILLYLLSLSRRKTIKGRGNNIFIGIISFLVAIAISQILGLGGIWILAFAIATYIFSFIPKNVKLQEIDKEVASSNTEI